MNDLMYCGDAEKEIRDMVLNDYPESKLEDASDFIHEGRFSVEVTCEEDDWYIWVMRKGIHNLSLNWELERMEHPERMKPLLMKVLEEQSNDL